MLNQRRCFRSVWVHLVNVYKLSIIPLFVNFQIFGITSRHWTAYVPIIDLYI